MLRLFVSRRHYRSRLMALFDAGDWRRCGGNWLDHRRRQLSRAVFLAVFETKQIFCQLFPRVALVAGTCRIRGTAHTRKLIASPGICKRSYFFARPRANAESWLSVFCKSTDCFKTEA